MPPIEVFADVACPFTHVGLRRFVARRDAEQRHDVRLRVHAWPLEIVNGEPIGPDLASEEIEQLRAQVAPDLFAGFDPAAMPTTSIPAFALVATAYRQGDDIGERVSLAVRNELFEEGHDIADPAVLAQVAAAVGVEVPDLSDDTPARADWDAGKRRGVQGSPHYFVGGEGFFCPSLDITHVDGHLQVKADPEEFDRFLDHALA